MMFPFTMRALMSYIGARSKAMHAVRNPVQQPLRMVSSQIRRSKVDLTRALDRNVPYDQNQAVIAVHIGNVHLQIPFTEILHTFWAGHLDSPCMACNRPFDSETGPPMRTISSAQNAESNCFPQLHVHNRHFACMTKDHWRMIVPISHAWDDSVAEAHFTRRSSDSATTLVTDVPSRVLMAVQNRFGRDIEIWHDYISIPQWQHETQQNLLHTLPVIFSQAQRSVCTWMTSPLIF